MPPSKSSLIDLIKAGHPDKVARHLAKRPQAPDHHTAIDSAFHHVVTQGPDRGPALIEALLPHATVDQVKAALNGAVFHAWRGSQERSELSVAMVHTLLRSAQAQGASFTSSRTLLQNAISGGHPEVVELLLQKCLPIESIDLATAAENNHNTVAILDLLLPHGHPAANDSWPLRAAALKGNVPAIHRLLPLSDVEVVVSHLAQTAQQIELVRATQPLSETHELSQWRAMERLAMEVPAAQAQVWVSRYGVEHFSGWQAHQRQLRANATVPSRPRSRSRPYV